MPLARIITESVDDSLELTMQLRARGFLVETVSPDQIPDAPADLEVRLEECSPEDVLSKAAQVTESEDLWVFVAPGALDERARPIRTIPLLPHTFDVPISSTLPKLEKKRPEAGVEKNSIDLAAPRMQAAPAPGLSETPSGSGNGGAKSDTAADLKRAPSPELPVILSGAHAKSTPDIEPTKVKVVVLPKSTEQAQIPGVPEKSKPINMVPVTIPVIGSLRLRGPYKISFRTGVRFWKMVAVCGPLAVLALVLVVVASLRPHLPPQAATPATSPAPSASSAGVKPAKTSQLPPAIPQGAGPDLPNVTSPATGQATDPAVPQMAVPKVAAKPVTESPSTSTANTSQDAAENASRKLASPLAKDPEKAHAAIVNRLQPARRHTASSEADIVAEDTVVFYDRKPASPGKSAHDPNVKR